MLSQVDVYDQLFFLDFFFSSRRRHTRFSPDWSSDVCSSDLYMNIYHENISYIKDNEKLERFSTLPLPRFRDASLDFDISPSRKPNFKNISSACPASKKLVIISAL